MDLQCIFYALFFSTPLNYIYYMTHCKTTDTFMWHNNHGNCGRDIDLALCYILWMGGREGWIIHTRHQGYAHNYYWTRVQAGHWSCGTRWKWLKTGILFTTLLRMSNMLITNWAVYFTFSGLFKTIQNFSNSGNSLKLGGITIFWSQVSFSSEYLGQINKKWFSFSIFFSSWFSQTWHIY